MKKIIAILLCIVIGSMVFAGGSKEPAKADLSKYPSKPITFIVNRGAGGSTDLVARAVANSIQHDKGFTTSVANYDGGDGLIGVAELMNSAPDGYTFCVIGCTEIPNMLANFEEAGFTKEDLYPVCQVSAKSRILVCAPNSPFKTLEDLKELDDKEIVARADAQAWDPQTDEYISISKIEYDLKEELGEYPVTFSTSAGTDTSYRVAPELPPEGAL